MYGKHTIQDESGVYLDSLTNNASESSCESSLYWFNAETNYGKVYIGIQKKKEEKDEIKLPKILHFAVSLSDGENLIKLLEDWLQCGLIPRPVSILPSSIKTINLGMTSQAINNDLREILIGFQDEILDRLPIPNSEQLQNVKIEAMQITAQAILSEFEISIDQFHKIKKGCVLLIPDSYEEKWYIKLKTIINRNINHIAALGKDIRTIDINEGSHYVDYHKSTENSASEYKIEERSYTKIRVIYIL